jgi:hypothetical protein
VEGEAGTVVRRAALELDRGEAGTIARRAALELDRDRDGHRHRDRDGHRHRDRDGHRHRDRDGHRHRDRDGHRHRDRDRDRDGMNVAPRRTIDRRGAHRGDRNAMPNDPRPSGALARRAGVILTVLAAAASSALAAPAVASARPLGSPGSPGQAGKPGEAPARITAVVRVVRQFGRGGACGTEHIIGAAEVVILESPSGYARGDRLIAIVSCPWESGLAAGKRFRMTLVSRRPSDWPRDRQLEKELPDLPRRYAIKLQRLAD